jgi:hypothetical protein
MYVLLAILMENFLFCHSIFGFNMILKMNFDNALKEHYHVGLAIHKKSVLCETVSVIQDIGMH